MYSPKVSEELIPRLYQLKQITKKPMTQMVNEAIAQYVTKIELENDEQRNPKNGNKSFEARYKVAL